MMIRCSAFVVFAAATLVPMAASAAGGIIRFSGAIVEPTRCQVSPPRDARQTVPRVSCVAAAGRPAASADSVVKVSTKALQPLPGRSGARDVPHRLVTLDYL
ncbi:hypothetical protein [Achromobacter sp. ESBL13]|uniref:hypothetical protein n=1 Tax=Achromobacter sp. ESBL13 TaxID=3077328 RepID=UPI002FCB1993